MDVFGVHCDGDRAVGIGKLTFQGACGHHMARIFFR